MAQISNSFATFNSSRVREQLLDKIWNVSVSETPTLALIGKEKVDGPLVEWLNDTFRAGASNKVEAGNTVTIISGDARYVGKTGTVSKAQRIRCYVEIPGVSKPVYLFTSDVEVMAAAEQAQAKAS
jgi:hypothetical protein